MPVTRDLAITETFTLPIELATRKTSIIAKSDAGKSYTLRRILECIVASGFAIPGALLDPLGVAYGVRYGPDGKSAGLSVPIFGGAHGDMPITYGSGAKIARALIESKTIGILDLSQLDDEEQFLFAREFVRAAGSILNETRQPFWLGADEADLFAPETPAKGAQAECQRAFRYYCRRVRNFGGGYTFATQSTSTIDKKVVGQSDLIIAMHITSPTDQKPIIEWFKGGIGEAEAKNIVHTLASFQKGDAVFYSPSWLKRVEPAHISRCETFDSSKTPEIGEVLETVGRGAAIDLDALRASIEQEDEPDDRDALLKTIEELRAQAAAGPALSATDRAQLDLIHEAINDLADVNRRAHDAIVAKFGEVATALGMQCTAGRPLSRSVERGIVEGPRPVREVKQRATVPKAQTPSDATKLRSGAIRMLEACAQFRDRGLTRGQLAALAKIKQGPTYSTYLSELRRLGYIDDSRERVYATTEGIAFLPNVPPAPRSGEEIIARWRPEFRAGAQRMLDAIVRAYPGTLSRVRLEREADILKGPTFSTYLSELKRAELIEEVNGHLRASILDLVGSGQ